MRAAEKTSLYEGIIFTVILIAGADYVPHIFGIDEPELMRLCAYAVRIISSTLIFSAVLYLYETYLMIPEKTFVVILSVFLRNMILPLLLSILLGLPLYAGNGGNIVEYDITLTQENIIDLRDKVYVFLNERSLPRRKINEAMLIIEETLMLVLERNGDKTIQAECTVKAEEGIEMIMRDDGVIFDITDTDSDIISFRSYIVANVMAAHKDKHNLTTTSFNRNGFYISL